MTGDGGMQITTNHGQDVHAIALPIGQMYHVAVDNQVPYWIYSNRQDDGTMRGAEHVARGGRRTTAGARRRVRARRTWRGGGRGGGRGGAAAAPWHTRSAAASRASPCRIPTNPDIVWASCYGNKVTRWDAQRAPRARSSPG